MAAGDVLADIETARARAQRAALPRRRALFNPRACAAAHARATRSRAQDKATMEMEAMEDGYVAKILKPDGAQNVVVGEVRRGAHGGAHACLHRTLRRLTQRCAACAAQPVLIMVEDAADVAKFASYAGGAAPAAAAAAPPPPAAPRAAAAAPPPPPQAAPPPPATPRAAAPPGGRVVASPLAKKTAADAGLSLVGVVGTGPGGRIIRADVEDVLAGRVAAPHAASVGAAVGAGAAAPAAASALDAFFPSYTDHSVSNIRRVTAKRLLESKQTVPHFYLSVDVRMDALLAARKALNASGDRKLSVNDLMIKAAALACARVPEVNSAWLGDKIRRYASVDVSVAVQTEAGLMVPIVRGADTKGLAAISAEVKALAAKAREGKLVPSEFVGGTFTISNLGMMGVKSFAAIVNPPQAAILAVGASRPEVVAAPGAPGGYASAQVLTATLSCDHRVVDGAVGAAWLAAFKGLLVRALRVGCAALADACLMQFTDAACSRAPQEDPMTMLL